MSSKKPLIKTTCVFAFDELRGKAAYRSLPSRSHETFDLTFSPRAAQRSFLINRALLIAVECLLILGLVAVLLGVIIPHVPT